MKSKRDGRLDIQAYLNDGIIVNIEMQVRNLHNIEERNDIYLAKTVSRHFLRKEKYENAKKVISINILNYNLFGFGYWISSALNYIIGSIFSYFANKYFTFKSEKKSGKEIIRFVLNIMVCYFIAYGIAKPAINVLLGNLNLKISLLEQAGMLLGMCIFIVINFIGQKFFVFKKK